MPATAVPVTEITRSGTTPPTAVTGDTSNGHSISNDGNMYLSVSNSAGSTGTVTISSPRIIDGQAVSARVVTIPANAAEFRIGPFPTASYGVTLNFTVSATTLTLRAYHFIPGQ